MAAFLHCCSFYNSPVDKSLPPKSRLFPLNAAGKGHKKRAFFTFPFNNRLMSLLFCGGAGCHISKSAFKTGIIKPLREEGGRGMSSQRRNKGILEGARAGRCFIPPSPPHSYNYIPQWGRKEEEEKK